MQQAIPLFWQANQPLSPHYVRWLLMLGFIAATIGTGYAQDFGAPATYPTGINSQPLGVALGDFTNDGLLDLLAVNVNTATLGVLPGLGDGTFGTAVSYAVGTGPPQGLQVLDLNGDGKLDVVLSSTSTVGVMLGRASGGLSPVVAYPALMTSQPGSLAVGDVNGDGKPDAVTVYNSTSTAYVLLGQTNGTLATAAIYPLGTATSPEAVAIGDVTGDGKADIVSANANNTVTILPGGGNGTFGAARLLNLGATGGLVGVALADVSADGRLDILVVNNTLGTVNTLIGQGSGTFAPAVSYSLGASYPLGIALSDTNGDGHLDVVTANFGSNSVSVLLGSATGTFGSPTVYSAGPNSSPISVVLGDLDSNSRPDIVLGNFGSPAAGVLLNTLPGLYLNGPGSGGAGTTLTLRGNSLVGATAATFGSSLTGSITISASSFISTNYATSPNTIALQVPTSLAAGTYTIRIATPRGPTNNFDFRVTAGALAQANPALVAADVRLAPNPAQATTHVFVPTVAGVRQAKLQLCSVLGQIVRDELIELPATGLEHTLDLSGLPTGTYVVRIQIGTSQINRRLVID